MSEGPINNTGMSILIGIAVPCACIVVIMIIAMFYVK